MNNFTSHVAKGAVIMAAAICPLGHAQSLATPSMPQQAKVDTQPLPGAKRAKQAIRSDTGFTNEQFVVLGILTAVAIGVMVSGDGGSNVFIAAGGTTGTR